MSGPFWWHDSMKEIPHRSAGGGGLYPRLPSWNWDQTWVSVITLEVQVLGFLKASS